MAVCYNPLEHAEEFLSTEFGQPCSDPRGEPHRWGRKSSFPTSSRKPQAGIQDEGAAFIGLLKTCTKHKDLSRGARLHDDILKWDLLEKCSDALVIMYAKCGDLKKAEMLLDSQKSRSVVTWTAVISGYVQMGRGQNALECFENMKHEGISPNAITYTCALKACASLSAIDRGEQIHDEIARRGMLQDVMLATALVDMYAKCGSLSKAKDVLQTLPSRDVRSGRLMNRHKTRDVIAWTALIAGYTREGQGQNALDCYECMQHEGVPPNAFTYACILKACALTHAINTGENIHNEITRQGLLDNDVVLGTALVDMYAKCGALAKAQSVLEKLPFRTVVSWNALIGGCAHEGQSEQALHFFECMQGEGVLPGAVTYACVLKACATLRALDKGKQIHEEIQRRGMLEKNGLLGTALVDMYAKCGALVEAQAVLTTFSFCAVGSWNALIAGYIQEGQVEKALDFFAHMQNEGVPSDAVTYSCILKACGSLGLKEKGEEIHDTISRQGLLQDNLVLGTALVDMYVKCGAPLKAQLVLEELPSRNVVLWSALISGYAQEGEGEQVINCFKRMQGEGILPNVVTFVCVLNVCSHLGLVEEGHALFVSMSTLYHVKPNLECYTCMVDLYGRAGHLEKAVQLIREMPSSGYSTIWLALLGACQKWGDVNVGRWAFDQAMQVDKSDGPAYILMANIYAAAGMLEYAEDIEAMRIRNRTWKKPGECRWIDSRNVVHAFPGRDTEHKVEDSIFKKLEDIANKMSHHRYSPDSCGMTSSIVDVLMAHLSCHHAEVLALACALINTPHGGSIHLTKNTRICGDCHVATSFISKIERRTIVITDANYRHHFQDGKCSCEGYL